MSKLKRLVICVLAVCSVGCLCFAAAACDKNSEYPAYRNPDINNNPENPNNPGGNVNPDDPNAPYSGTYTISVKSVGGLALDGVRIAAKQNGITVKEGISADGIINFSLEKGEYDLEIVESSLPAGYYLPTDYSYKTNAELANTAILLPSKIISTTASGSTRYSVGDVMYDFSFTDVGDGTRHTLSDVFEGKKAVVLNFFYTTCNPCKSEFPALQSAYDNFSDDLAVIALADTSMDPDYKAVASFKENMELDFYMGQDQAGIGNLFSVSSYPTTVIVDRYGVVAYRHAGSIVSTSVWNSMFSTYTSDEYVQNGSQGENPDNGNSQELIKPNVEMSPSAAISNAINGDGTDGKIDKYTPETNQADAEYAWPWVVKTESDGSCITATNVNINNSYANIYTTIKLNAGDILSYEYNVITESGTDVLYVLIDREIIAEHSGNSNGWQTNEVAFVAQRDITVEFALSYLKDEAEQPEGERASIRNIRIENARNSDKAVDIYTSAVSGIVDPDSGKYTSYANVVFSSADNYYHFESVDGPILFADILNSTAWSDLHFGSKKFNNPDGNSVTASLYQITYWEMSNWKDLKTQDVALKFAYGHTDTVIDNYYWQGFSANGFVPVSESLKQALIAFTEKYCEQNDESYYEQQWLELCYYGVHYGRDHIKGDSCEIYTDPIKALDFSNAYEISLNRTTHVNIDIILKWNNGGGKFYKFVPDKTGIYYFYSDFGKWQSDPHVIVYDQNRNVIGQFNDDMSVTTFTNRNRYNFYGYAYMVAGETYYFQCRCSVPGTIGEFDFTVKFTGKSEYDLLRVCTTGDGLWSYGDTGTYYLAIDVALGDDDIYYEVKKDGSLGSKIYIDFVHPNYYDANGHTLKEIVDNGNFNLGGKDYTATMNKFYQEAIAGKDEGDELYGMHEATKELVDVLCAYFDYAHSESRISDYWLSLAAYLQHFGA